MSKKTCSDCIHCQMCRWIDDMVKNCTCDFFKDWKELEKRPHGEWIPCSERLPEEGQKAYLVTIDYGNGLSCVATRFFWDEKRLWNEAEEYITAWMPLPEPYKREGDEK